VLLRAPATKRAHRGGEPGLFGGHGPPGESEVQSPPPANLKPVTEALADLTLIASGKVREIYDLDDTFLIVASDRISTYDVVHPNPIPDKGKVLTGLSTFWFERTGDIVPNHLISVTDGVPAEARGRGMVVRRLEMLPVEAVVRGYITGSGWKDYQRTGAVCGIPLPSGLRESDRLPEPIFTPATKAELGSHDENIDFEGAARLIGDRALAERLRDVSIALYEHAAEHARDRGIILADTKFELGLDSEGVLTLGDEALTPDSSRFWPVAGYEPGRSQPSFDKQFVRDWASGTGWERNPPAPAIPEEVVRRTREKYVEAYELITGEPFDAWLQRTGG
jgi:phosphoribosylaminoimidazole-succinocarboxamide synthase